MLNWRGDEIKKNFHKRVVNGINKVMAECVLESKRNHPGWRNRTSMAEGSVRVTMFAMEKLPAIIGKWGSTTCHYVKWLELKHGSFMRVAAQKIYPRLAGYVRNG